MRILAVDPGKTTGVVVGNIEGRAFTEELSFEIKNATPFSLYKRLSKFEEIKTADVVVHGIPVRHFNVIKSQSKLVGALEVFAGEHGIQTIEAVDSACKKAVLGSGRANKIDIMSRYGRNSEHIADCLMFIEWHLDKITS